MLSEQGCQISTPKRHTHRKKSKASILKHSLDGKSLQKATQQMMAEKAKIYLPKNAVLAMLLRPKAKKLSAPQIYRFHDQQRLDALRIAYRNSALLTVKLTVQVMKKRDDYDYSVVSKIMDNIIDAMSKAFCHNQASLVTQQRIKTSKSSRNPAA